MFISLHTDLGNVFQLGKEQLPRKLCLPLFSLFFALGLFQQTTIVVLPYQVSKPTSWPWFSLFKFDELFMSLRIVRAITINSKSG